VVAAVAAVVSYRHAYEIVSTHGKTSVTAQLVPFTVDALIFAASMYDLWHASASVRSRRPSGTEDGRSGGSLQTARSLMARMDKQTRCREAIRTRTLHASSRRSHGCCHAFCIGHLRRHHVSYIPLCKCPVPEKLGHCQPARGITRSAASRLRHQPAPRTSVAHTHGPSQLVEQRDCDILISPCR
jgi:Protein of unknown function (DUF2637)